MIKEIKTIIDSYLNNLRLPAVLVGTYNGSAVTISANFVVPRAVISGNLIEAAKPGDKLRLFAPTGWDEFYVLEIIGRATVLRDGIRAEALK